MTQYERMRMGMIYDPADKEIMELQRPFQQRLWELNRTGISDTERKERYMRDVFAACGKNCWIELPFWANWGGKNLHLGSGVYINFNLTLVDDGQIFIGDHTLIGPNVTIATANHPIEPELRIRGLQYNRDVHIGDNVWIGAGVTIVPGVSIGNDSVIGAGSVVTRDIPEGVVAVGAPCRVLREIGQNDREYFYRSERIDWENL